MARPKGSGVTPAADRFWPKVEGDEALGCWTWQGASDHHGYGRFWLGDGRYIGAHRFAYEHLRDDIPAGLQLDHLCTNASCVNPWHLEPVTGAENMRRWVATNTHCSHGHEFTPENTAIRANGTRRCRTCRWRYPTDPPVDVTGATADAYLGLG